MTDTTAARLRCEHSDCIRWISVNRPEKHNAFAPGLIENKCPHALAREGFRKFLQR